MSSNTLLNEMTSVSERAVEVMGFSGSASSVGSGVVAVGGGPGSPVAPSSLIRSRSSLQPASASSTAKTANHRDLEIDEVLMRLAVYHQTYDTPASRRFTEDEVNLDERALVIAKASEVHRDVPVIELEVESLGVELRGGCIDDGLEDRW